MRQVLVKITLLSLVVLALARAQAQDEFVISDIRVEGLQRISAGTVFNYLPVSVGSSLSPDDYPEIIRSLFKTGFFADVSLERSGDVLVITVTERPAIAELSITGNKDISTEDLEKSLKEVGLSEGRVFDRSLLEQVEQELIRQYYSRGKYAVKIDAQAKPMPRNRVAVELEISEGVAARIRQINIVGNQAFDDDELLEQFQLSTSGWLSILTRDDQYSKQRLSGDIEALRSFYLDRGYLEFDVTSTQVSITPDKRDIYITINIVEGDRFKIRDVEIVGELIVPESELRRLITVRTGDYFSRSTMTEITQSMVDRLGDEGYAFANVNPVPELISDSQEVSLTFVVDPGRRVYVRRVNFSGNIKTQDEVLRREMRQIEGGWFANKDVERSKTRLERLRYLESVNIETPSVPGSADQVDVEFAVVERPSGNLLFGAGWGQEGGLLLNASLDQANFMGTGNRVSFTFNNSRTDTIYNFSYTNPYYTIDGISRGFRFFYRDTDLGDSNVADYQVDAFGGSVNFGFPINEFDTFRTDFGFERKKFDVGTDTAEEIVEFLDDNGDDYLDFALGANWSRDSRNRAIFPDNGSLNRIGAQLTLPGSDAEYYKIDLRHRSYLPFTRWLTASFKGEVGVGDGYGNVSELPFFENYYAGG
jgi:outer membrane protein insertion porin family